MLRKKIIKQVRGRGSISSGVAFGSFREGPGKASLKTEERLEGSEVPILSRWMCPFSRKTSCRRNTLNAPWGNDFLENTEESAPWTVEKM